MYPAGSHAPSASPVGATQICALTPFDMTRTSLFATAPSCAVLTCTLCCAERAGRYGERAVWRQRRERLFEYATRVHDRRCPRAICLATARHIALLQVMPYSYMLSMESNLTCLEVNKLCWS